MTKSVRILAMLFVAACAEEKNHPPTDVSYGPDVSGLIDLAPGISLDGYIGITNVLYYPSIDDDPYSRPRPPGFDDLPSTWPTTFVTVSTFGGGRSGIYPLRAWLSREHNETAPPAGTPVAETTLLITCDPVCDGPTDVMLLLQAPTE